MASDAGEARRRAKAERRADRAAQRRLREDTTPGKVLALAIMANAPIFIAFVIVPLLTGGDAAAARRYAPVVVWATPLFAVLSVGIYLRAPALRKAHRAARIGLMLSLVGLLLWGIVLYSTLAAPVETV